MVWYAGIIAKGIRGLSITNVALWLVSTVLTVRIIAYLIYHILQSFMDNNFLKIGTERDYCSIHEFR